MESVRETEKKYCSRAMIVAIIVGLVFILADYKPLGRGLILGTFFSILNFVLIGETLSKRIEKTKRKTFFLSLGSILVRYLLLAVPLFTAIKLESYNFFAATAGIFMVQLMILLEHVAVFISSTRKKS